MILKSLIKTAVYFLILIIVCYSLIGCSVSKNKELSFLNMSLEEALNSEPVFPPEYPDSQDYARLSINGPTNARDAYQVARAVAAVRIESWMGEDENGPGGYYAATVIKTYKGELPEHFILRHDGTTRLRLRGNVLNCPGTEVLLFLEKSTDADNLYYERGSYVSVFDAIKDDNGDVYYCPRVDSFADFIEAKNYANDSELATRLRNNLIKVNPKRSPGVVGIAFAENELADWFKTLEE